MIVTRIKEVSKARLEIEIDNEFAFVLYKGELRTYGIKEGQEIKKENYEKIIGELLPSRARKRAMNLLTKRSYTSKQLTDKLMEGGYSKQITEAAISYVASFGYIDDEQYTTDFIEYNMEKKSRLRIFQDLQKRGISKEIITDVWNRVAGSNAVELERQQLIQLMEKKKFSPETEDYSQRQKMLAFFYRKGFSMETIRSVLSLDITSI